MLQQTMPYLLIIAKGVAEHLGQRNQRYVPNHAEERVEFYLSCNGENVAQH